jgi:fructan beta-fructosidase
MLLSCGAAKQQLAIDDYSEPHRPQIHFSPPAKWMNDPNGMVYFNNTYHLFYQFYPDSTVWGPMHWGHATSKNMIDWEHQPIALYPDTLGYIFSGSVVADVNNTFRPWAKWSHSAGCHLYPSRSLGEKNREQAPIRTRVCL